ncbi:hypothetical protein RRG08_042782 [Elysia crispata]|uniref:Uncharacterized protein n=1 Tax=Elysia crispata TaxID=231223 RepID=A0AAE0XRM3_9GAST|nr:hypothetical protein RRG08_042782 [Elysia crispata]
MNNVITPRKGPNGTRHQFQFPFRNQKERCKLFPEALLRVSRMSKKNRQHGADPNVTETFLSGNKQETCSVI